jgi:diamine N-acetyltransferase
MKIRTAKTEDVNQIMIVFKEYEEASICYLSKEYKSMRNKKKPVDKHIKLALKKDIKQKNSKYFVMEENDKVVGYIFGEIRDDSHPLYNRPKTGELNDIAVLKEYQGKSISTKLWKVLLAWFKENKCEMVTLSVNSNNKAQEIYKKWGFELFYLRMIRKI